MGTAPDRFSTAPDEPNHEEITATALAFLQPAIIVALQAANVATDVEFHFVNAHHFDDCNFSGGSEVVVKSQAEAVAALDPSNATPEADLLAIRAFGRSLHALQDFYAHTNWVELGGEVLIDSSLGAFPLFSPYTTTVTAPRQHDVGLQLPGILAQRGWLPGEPRAYLLAAGLGISVRS